MNKVFNMSGLGLLNFYFGIEVFQERNCIKPSQKSFCRKDLGVLEILETRRKNI